MTDDLHDQVEPGDIIQLGVTGSGTSDNPLPLPGLYEVTGPCGVASDGHVTCFRTRPASDDAVKLQHTRDSFVFGDGRSLILKIVAKANP